MNILQNRIDSFQNNAVKWPYVNNTKYAKTESFAKAGFYFVRRPKASDSVRCFLCDVELSHWKPNQSPFVRHGHESPHCGWKRLNFPDARKKPLSDPTKAMDSPRSVVMRSARIDTFNCHNYWPPKKGTAKYPPAAKVASAGFYFSPTASLPSRVKCAYCGEATTVNPNETDLLNKHQNLSSSCAFFETHSTRNTRSTRSSSVKGDESDTDSSTSKRTINTVSTSSETSAPISKRQKEQGKVSKPVASKKLTSGKELVASNKAKGVQKAVTKIDDPIWDFNQLITPPKPTRRAIITYGSSRPVHHVPRSARNNPSSVNILPDFKSSLIIKPNGPYIDSPATRPINNTKKAPQASTEPEVIRTRCLQKPEGSSSGTSVPRADPPRKRSLSASSVTDSAAPPTKKHVVKIPIDTEVTKAEITSSPVSKDKGKGREVEHNLQSNLPAKKPISLSRSRNKLPEIVSPSISKERGYVPVAEGSGTPRQPPVHAEPAKVIHNVLPSNNSNDTQDVQEASPRVIQDVQDASPHITHDTQGVSEPIISQDPQDPQDDLPYVQNSPPSPVYTSDDDHFVDKENIPPPISYSPVRDYESIYNDQHMDEHLLTPVYCPSSPQISDYSPELIVPFSSTPSPPPHPASSAIVGMSFLQSTPSDTQRRLANAIDIFGSAPMSPIRPHQSIPLGELQYTPAMTEGRVARIITQDEEGTSRIVRAEEEPSQAGLLSDCLLRNQNMTVEQHWHSLVDASIERLQEICDSDIQRIEEKFNLTRSYLERDL